MIPVQAQPEPPRFDAEVRQRGLRVLTDRPDALPPYWRACLGDLHAAYRGICAYVCIYLEPVVAGRSVDHFIAKSADKTLAYEWSNYRLACAKMNSRKRDFTDVLDPFEVDERWFVLEFEFLQILPSPQLDANQRVQVEETIARLKLDDAECRRARSAYYEAYIEREISFAYLERRCPFVAVEMKYQGLVRAEDLGA